ncbi:GNAT family N-acetyltransferase [Bacillus sp. Bva_UNVM-123]|uniref:GNAT family N-acetyltransferase n=1 Tax=Bacillus sp. Bva_UNVM-123 TaxID=2829798 RepID=UPI00391FAE11
MKVYKATLIDLEHVSQLFDLYRVFYKQSSNIGAAKEFIRERMEKEDSVIFIAVENGSYLGFTQLYPSFSSVSMKRLWILNDLYVTREARNKGVAKKLLDAAKQLAIDTQAKGLNLQTALDNLAAQSLYEADGWVKDEAFYSYELILSQIN